MSRYNSIVVLTGAGVSAESGIKTFRDNNGLWENNRIEDVCTPEAFARNPALVQQFYNARRHQLVTEAHPNPAHIALAEFERKFSGDFTLVTQNVDDLHERAGSHNLIHMHGELRKARCAITGTVFSWSEDITADNLCPCCSKTGVLRPHIVWFGEIPLQMTEIEAALAQCDLFVAIGTSGQVYPAAGFVQLATVYGAHTVELNLEKTQGRNLFSEHHYGPASVTVQQFFHSLL